MNGLEHQLAEELRKRLGPPDEAPPPEESGAIALALLSETIRAQALRRRARRVTVAALAVAAAAILGVVSWLVVRASSEGLQVESAHLALVTRGGASEAAAEGSRLELGSRVETTSGGSVKLGFKSGTEVWLDQRSALELLSVGADQHLRLSSGRVRAEVAHLEKGHRFRIVTPDSQVEVRGTRFSVEWAGEAACPGQAATRVRVDEGVVWVQHGSEEVEVHAGGVWPLPCPPAVVVPVPVPVETAKEVPAPPAPKLSPSPRSRLAEENRRFGEVLQARQAGRNARALQLIDQLRRDFPHGQLEEDVCVEEMRVATGLNPARARKAALSYLAQFPHGYARALAEELTRSQP